MKLNIKVITKGSQQKGGYICSWVMDFPSEAPRS